MTEIRVSPDRDSVAIRRDTPEGDFRAWAVMHREHGGHYAPASEVEDWPVLDLPEPTTDDQEQENTDG